MKKDTEEPYNYVHVKTVFALATIFVLLTIMTLAVNEFGKVVLKPLVESQWAGAEVESGE